MGNRIEAVVRSQTIHHFLFREDQCTSKQQKINEEGGSTVAVNWFEKKRSDCFVQRLNEHVE